MKILMNMLFLTAIFHLVSCGQVREAAKKVNGSTQKVPKKSSYIVSASDPKVLAAKAPQDKDEQSFSLALVSEPCKALGDAVALFERTYLTGLSIAPRQTCEFISETSEFQIGRLYSRGGHSLELKLHLVAKVLKDPDGQDIRRYFDLKISRIADGSVVPFVPRATTPLLNSNFSHFESSLKKWLRGVEKKATVWSCLALGRTFNPEEESCVDFSEESLPFNLADLKPDGLINLKEDEKRFALMQYILEQLFEKAQEEDSGSSFKLIIGKGSKSSTQGKVSLHLPFKVKRPQWDGEFKEELNEELSNLYHTELNLIWNVDFRTKFDRDEDGKLAKLVHIFEKSSFTYSDSGKEWPVKKLDIPVINPHVARIPATLNLLFSKWLEPLGQPENEGSSDEREGGAGRTTGDGGLSESSEYTLKSILRGKKVEESVRRKIDLKGVHFFSWIQRECSEGQNQPNESCVQVLKDSFIGADFSYIDLSGSVFSQLSLFGAQFKNAVLSQTRFIEVGLAGADFSDPQIKFDRTLFIDCNLKEAHFGEHQPVEQFPPKYVVY